MFRRRFPWPVLATGCVGLGLLVIVAVGLRYVDAIRSDGIATTAMGIRRGNYFAWRQAGRWWNRLSETEQRHLLAACEDWAQLSSSLHWKDEVWPTASQASSFLAGGLPCDTICLPAFYQVPVEMYWPGRFGASNK